MGIKKKIVRRKLNHFTYEAMVGFFVIFFLFFFVGIGRVSAASPIVNTSQSDWGVGKFENNQIDAATSSGDIQLALDLGNWNASGPANLNHLVNGATKMMKIGNYLYAFRNKTMGQLFRYDFETREWKEMALTPIGIGDILDATTNGTDTIYAFATRGTGLAQYKHFLKYDIPSNTWSFLAETPNILTNYSTLEYVGPNYIYATRSYTYDFWRYDITTDKWTVLSNNVAYCSAYCDFAYDGSRYMYLSSDWSSPDRFYRYDMTLKTWGRLADLPVDGAVGYPSEMSIYGNNIFMMRGSGTNTFYKYTIDSNSWTTAANLPYMTSYGTLESDIANSRLIVLGGVGEIWYYYPSTNTWSVPLNGPPNSAMYTGKNLESDGNGNLFMCRGQSTTTCYKYVVSTNTWVTLSAAPVSLGAGNSIGYANNSLYVARGSNGTDFYQYNPSNDTWSAKAVSPGNFDQGSALVGSDSASIFAFRGGGNSTFYKYNIAANTWDTKASFPDGVFRGGGLVKAGVYIYGLGGYNRGKFARYNETANTWTNLSPLPVGSYHGGGITYDGGNYIYAQAGGDNDQWSRQFYRYNIAKDLWQRLPDTPEMIRSGGYLAWYNNNIYSYQGFGGGFWKYNLPSGANTYVTSGTWFSPVYDQKYVSSWGTFSETEPSEQPSGTTVTYYSRTSDNQNVWSPWAQVTSGSTLPSPANRYLQIKVVLTGDGVLSPKVSGYQIHFTGDTSPPDISAISITGKSQKNGALLASGQPYTYTNPYFSWNEGIDVGEGLDGYYVYFGEDSSADPEALGNYQSGTDYTSALGMTASKTYYLRIKAKDKTGLVSSIKDAFTYTYNGISPVSTTILATSQDDWDSKEATKSGVYTGDASWWNRTYSFRKQLLISPIAIASPGAVVKVTVDTNALVSGNKLRSDRNDWRIVYWNGLTWQEIARQYVSISETRFKLQKGINGGSSDANYYVYYGNSSETTDPPSFDSWSGAETYKNTAALAFDGSDDYVNIPNPSQNLAGDLTVEFWAKGRNYINNRTNVISKTYGGEFGISMETNGNVTYFHGQDTSNYFSWSLFDSANLKNNEWQHITITRDQTNKTLKSYLNGVLKKVYTNYAINPKQSTSAITIGKGWAGSFKGNVDEVRIWNTALTGDQIRARMSTKIDSSDSIWSNLIGYWKMDDGNGQTVTDSSGNNNNGTLGTNSSVASDDPAWVIDSPITATSNAEESTPVTIPNNSLTLQKMGEGSWAGYQLPTAPNDIRSYYGAAVTAKNSVFVLRGANSQLFSKLDLRTNEWVSLAEIPAPAYYGSIMAYDGNDTIYAARGYDSTDFYKYTISTNTWSSNIAQPSAIISYGAAMIKAGNDSLYLFRGNSNTDFLKYTISTDTWTAMAASLFGVNNGAGLAYDGNNTIYAVTGGNGTGFEKYLINSNEWDVSAPLIPYNIGYYSNNLMLQGNYLYAFTTSNYGGTNDDKHYIWRFNISKKLWESVPSPADFWANQGAVAYDGTRYAYIIQGDSDATYGATAVYRFDTLTDIISPSVSAVPVDKTYYSDWEMVGHRMWSGSTLVYDNADTLYTVQGAYNWVNKYSVSTKKWSQLPSLSCGTYYGGTVFANNTLFSLCGGGTQTFLKYNDGSMSWTKLADAPTTIGYGSQTIAFDGNDTIYALKGSGSQILYKYSISANTWTVASSNIPGGIPNWGSSLTYDGNGNLFIVRGNISDDFYRFNTTSLTWTVLPAIPVDAGQGAQSVYHDGQVYFLPGNNNQQFYIYDIASNVWKIGAKTMAPSGIGSSIVNGPDNTLYALQGNNAYTLWKYNVPTNTTSYTYTGTYTSKVFDLGNPYAWANLSATVASPSATSVIFETRTSSDSASWSSWAEAADLKQIAEHNFIWNITSSPKRYFQFRVTMNSDESMYTPTVSDVSVTYYNDNEPPANPNTLTSYRDNTKERPLVNNTWYNASTPYFEWDAANDASGSGTMGYYVYFGQDNNAVASLSGTFTTDTHYSPLLTTDGEYYLVIQAMDNAGNINNKLWSPFHYRYDSTPPTIPASVASNPRTYTSVDNYTMFWLPVDDIIANSTSSGLLGYSYKTGTSSGVFSENQQTTGLQITGVTAYQTGKNSFYLQSEDVAGNVSKYAEASYYFNGDAPSVIKNLEVTPATSSANLFSFLWDEPESFRGSISEYRYSVNVPISNANYSSAYSRMLIPGPYATVKGKNTFYVVGVDEAGNVNYDPSNVASVDFWAQTKAPGIPMNPEAFDNSIRSTQQYRIGLTWDRPTELGSSFGGYAVYISESEKADCTKNFGDFKLAGTTAGSSYLVTSWNNLPLESKKYYLCVKSYDTTNQYSSPSTTVSEFPTGRWLEAAEMTGSQSAAIRTKSAVISWTTNRTSNSFVKFGKKTGEYTTEVGSSNQDTYHEITLLGLDPGTTYYYKTLWADEDGNMGESGERTFTTNPAPFVSKVKFSRININSSDVTFTIKSAIKASIQYGRTIGYGSIMGISTSKSETSYTVEVPNLTEGTTYHLRIAAEDDEGNVYNSDDYSFETLPVPKISNLRLQQVVGMPSATLRLLWSTNTLASSVISYYPTATPQLAQDNINLVLKTNHEVILKNLLDNTDYTILIKGKDSAGNETKTETRSLKTANDVRPPEIQNLSVETSIIGVGDSAQAQIVVTWDTDEPGTTQVEYGQGTGTTYNQTTQEDTNLTMNHAVTITSLSPSKIYHLHSLSKDKVGNVGQSLDTVIITPKSTKDALNLVIDNLSKTFGFLKGTTILK